MSRVNISVPDDLYAAAKSARLNISELTRRAIADELDRRAKVAELDRYLAELDDELGPVRPEQELAAATWAERVYGPRRPGERTA